MFTAGVVTGAKLVFSGGCLALGFWAVGKLTKRIDILLYRLYEGKE